MNIEPLKLAPWIKLSDYLDGVRHNMNGPIPVYLKNADETIGLLVKNLHNSTGIRSLGLINYAYSTWRSCILLTLSGSTAQVPALQRLCLEAGLYAYLFKFDESMRVLWEERHSKKSSMSKFRKQGMPTAKAILKKKNPRLAASLENLYNHLIDFGAHPNVLAIENISNYVLSSGDTHGSVTFTVLAGQRDRDFANLNTTALALMIIEIACFIWPTRAIILGMEARLAEVRKLAAIGLAEIGHNKAGI